MPLFRPRLLNHPSLTHVSSGLFQPFTPHSSFHLVHNYIEFFVSYTTNGGSNLSFCHPQISLHESFESTAVNKLQYAVAPGTHTLVQIERNEV